MGKTKRVGWGAVAIAAIGLLWVVWNAVSPTAVQTQGGPLTTAIASVVSPAFVLEVVALVMIFMLAVVALAIRTGRSVRMARGGVHIGGKRRR